MLDLRVYSTFLYDVAKSRRNYYCERMDRALTLWIMNIAFALIVLFVFRAISLDWVRTICLNLLCLSAVVFLVLIPLCFYLFYKLMKYERIIRFMQNI